MINLKTLTRKRANKHDRERKVLLGLVDFYLKTGKPVGSNTLKDAGFEDLSSATIRNYFGTLEKEGYLIQQHTSGGRIPSELALKEYAAEHLLSSEIDQEIEDLLKPLKTNDSHEIATFLSESAETLSSITNCAVFLSAPRFDHDFILDIKLVGLDLNRNLAILITDFGVIRTEILHSEKKLTAFTLKRIESYFHFRLTGLDKPEHLEPEEEALAQRLYNELMVRYIVGYSNFTDEELYRTGFSKLLSYPEYQDTATLASSLSLFENAHSMRLILRESGKMEQLKFWIGKDLLSYSQALPNCTVLAIPYYINSQVVGAVGILGPMRMPYRDFFGIMRHFSATISEGLAKKIYKFKISVRSPERDFNPYQTRIKYSLTTLQQFYWKIKEKIKMANEQTTPEEPLDQDLSKESPKEPKMVEINEAELEMLKKDAAEAKDKYLRLLAESENARKRLQKEKQELIQFALQNILVEFLHPLDHLENALKFTQEMSDDVKHWGLGFQMILNQFKEVLANNGAEPIDSKGKLFNPHLHEAVETVETDDVKPGIILEEFIRGYKMGDRTIRPARVKVAKTPSIKEEINEIKEGE